MAPTFWRFLAFALPVLSAVEDVGAQIEFRPGLTLHGAYVGDAFYNAAGGVREGGAVLHNFDVTLGVDGEQVLGIEGLEAFAYVLANDGGSVVEYAGDWQVASNIEAPAAVRLYELWVQQRWGDRGSLRVGLYDLNSEFYVADAATLFINSGHGIGPEFAASGVAGPSIFPVTALVARIEWFPTSGSSVRLAVLDAVPGDPDDESRVVHIELDGDEGALVTAEAAIADEASARKLALGGWTYTADFPDAAEPELTHYGTYGLYLLGETRLISATDGSGGGLAGFARIGYADPDVHPVQWSWGGGLVYDGLPGREEDRIGLGLSAGVHGSRYLRAQDDAGAPLDRSETALELTYSLPITSWLRFQPDFQYIVNPGLAPERDDAVLVGTRVELSF